MRRKMRVCRRLHSSEETSQVCPIIRRTVSLLRVAIHGGVRIRGDCPTSTSPIEVQRRTFIDFLIKAPIVLTVGPVILNEVATFVLYPCPFSEVWRATAIGGL